MQMQFDNGNSYGNLIFVSIFWKGTATIASLTDDQGNLYTLVSNSNEPVSGINIATYWSLAYNLPDGQGSNVGLTITAVYSAAATNNFLIISEFNPATPSNVPPLDQGSISTYISSTGEALPAVTATLSGTAELVIASLSCDGQGTITISPGWHQVETVSVFGAAMYWTLNNTPGPFVVAPGTPAATGAQILTCSGWLNKNAANVQPTIPQGPWAPLLSNPDYLPNLGTPARTTLLQALQQIESASNGNRVLLDWNGNGYPLSQLITACQSGGLVSIANTTVEYSQTLGTIIQISAGLRYGTMFVVVPSLPSVPKTQFQYYGLAPSGAQAIDPAILANPLIYGISIRAPSWKQTKSSKTGPYNWTFPDSEAARARAAGKRYMLRFAINAGNCPNWVINNSQQFNPSSGAPIAVYWDPVFQADYIQFMTDIAARYGSDPFFAQYQLQLATTDSANYAVPHSKNDITNWQNNYGYTTSRMIAAGQTLVDAAMSIFPPSVQITAGVGPNGNLDAQPNAFCEAVATYAASKYGNRFLIEKNSLQAVLPYPGPVGTLPPNWGIMSDLLGVVKGCAQFLWWSYGDLTYRNNKGKPAPPATVLNLSMENASIYDLQYIEIYSPDAETNPQCLV